VLYLIFCIIFVLQMCCYWCYGIGIRFKVVIIILCLPKTWIWQYSNFPTLLTSKGLNRENKYTTHILVTSTKDRLCPHFPPILQISLVHCFGLKHIQGKIHDTMWGEVICIRFYLEGHGHSNQIGLDWWIGHIKIYKALQIMFNFSYHYETFGFGF